jgi:hypothetical protein
MLEYWNVGVMEYWSIGVLEQCKDDFRKSGESILLRASAHYSTTPTLHKLNDLESIT